jgi:hypothetical protein
MTEKNIYTITAIRQRLETINIVAENSKEALKKARWIAKNHGDDEYFEDIDGVEKQGFCFTDGLPYRDFSISGIIPASSSTKSLTEED